MSKIKIPNAEIESLLTGKNCAYPKYTTQLMNLANQNAQGTRPRIVGQMSELIQEFIGSSFEEWDSWYKTKYPNGIDTATDKVFEMIQQLKQAVEKIDKELVKQWITDLVIAKTFSGLKFQEIILKKVSLSKGTSYRLATKKEESIGIDGYIGETPVSIKPVTYKTMMALSENIESHIIFYEKKKYGITIEFSF